MGFFNNNPVIEFFHRITRKTQYHCDVGVCWSDLLKYILFNVHVITYNRL
ncbi:BAF_collapsed_G0001580.mRNA.1.CDS.1 [Saccharomyces cerevisiae]|nr:BAF_collapsed_G0001580.mRNA.1.CDS.1 [Saccharomyces cerevisiae]